jgi:hypothetical protein
MASAETPTPATSPATSPATPSGTGGSDNSFGRIFGVLFSPQATFESIVRKPTWVLPLILFVFVGVAATTVITQRVTWRTVIDREIAKSPKAQKRLEQLAPEQRDQQLNIQAKYAPYFVYGINVLAPFIVAVVAGAIFMVAFNVVGGTKIAFKTSLAIYAYAWVPGLIAGLLAIVVLFIKDPSTVDVKNIVASNPGALLSDDSPKWLVSLLSSLDLFSFWEIILLAIGYRAADPKKISFGMALGTVVSVWLIYVLIGVGWNAAFS